MNVRRNNATYNDDSKMQEKFKRFQNFITRVTTTQRDCVSFNLFRVG